MTCILASNNPDKAREIRALFALHGMALLTLADVGVSFVPGEDGGTFVGNAVQKATETASFLSRLGDRAVRRPYAVIADDSGLAVDALGGLPGVDSALYLGVGTPFDKRMAHILELMKDVPDEERAARFVCVAACVLPDGEVITTSATLEGRIAYEPAGDGGFGYDPIFYIPEYGLTAARLSVGEKNKISHRGKAMGEMVRKLGEYICNT
jgi:XTP/dITP diphosphohydrolase